MQPAGGFPEVQTQETSETVFAMRSFDHDVYYGYNIFKCMIDYI